MIYIQVDEPFETVIPEKLLEQAAEETLRHGRSPQAALQEADLTIVLTDDEALQKLNLEFMGIDAPTDVLSFPADLIDPDSGKPYLGDVLISVPRAQAQAPENQQSVQDEILLLAVHGVLHLLGYDHAEPEEKEQMWARQNLVLGLLRSAGPG